eukprot:CAMPEP_0116145628 /NCGR_PEP_ID=MMETSP0329-20121206/16705_1 /TAXON_ID=697910 /ORGANISM="Pseudo-nitzschia arenysensis, Strain B593" /LENGTH=529 /DNA_ID=CAMNT_0003641267 /DNA_START=1 /DNA_END=1590 /DNA_ORIENTATION=-
MAPSNKPPLKGLVTTETTVLQKQTERECQPYLVDLTTLPDDQKAHLARIGLFREDCDDTTENKGKDWVQLLRDKHRRYLEGVWKRPLKAPFVSLDSSRPWMLYWCLHGYDLLSLDGDEDSWISDSEGSRMIATLEDCWEGYHTPKSQIPEIVPTDTDDPFYFGSQEDDETSNDGETRYYCGGFGGGPGQMAHAATTYAAVLALCILATSGQDDEPSSSDANDDDKDYESLHYSKRARKLLSEIRIPLYRWMVSLQVPETGGYRMQHDGEVDVRATYTIACCSKLLGLLEDSKNFTVLGRPKVIDFVRSCQTYEGGMGGEPFSEAHGGYTFCAVAALKLLGALVNEDHKSGVPFDVSALLGWLGRRQLSYEGGFSGRSNKLVDGCYSFWQGGAMAIASSCSECLANDETDDTSSKEDPWLAQYEKQGIHNASTADQLPFPLLYDVFMLERYILLCAQEVTGGLRDKPSKPRDFYHTCYNLSGLSVAQHCSYDGDLAFGDPEQTVVGHTHPCYNIRIDRVAKILKIQWDTE